MEAMRFKSGIYKTNEVFMVATVFLLKPSPLLYNS